MDGVLADSRAVVDDTWSEWARERGLDPQAVLRAIPGKRTRDAVALVAPHLDPDAETAYLIERESAAAELVKPIPGAAELIAQLPPGRWGIATSGTRDVARPRLRYAGITAPDVFVTAEMVERGKPDPQAYLRAAAGLAQVPRDCLVFEDAPSGLAAAASAGCVTVGVRTWAPPGLLAATHIVRDLRHIYVTEVAACLIVRLNQVELP